MSAESITFSFCIPIYNFGRFVGETIESIIENAQDGLPIEIVVLDGGSTDETPEVMLQYCRKFPQIRYIRNEARGGIDADLHAAVTAARGEYCWLLSGDDVLREGAFARLSSFLQSKSDVYLCEHIQCDFRLRFLYDYPIFSKRLPSIVDLAERRTRQIYLAKSLNTETCFSYMSGLIVRRDVWLSSEPPEFFKGSCWWHVARLFEQAKRSLIVCYVGESWVNRRGENDSFLDRGLVRRLGIAIDGYQDLANHYFGADSNEAFHIRRLVRADIKFVLYMHAKAMTRENPTMESRNELDRLVRRAYCDRSFSCFAAKCVYFWTPVSAYKTVRAFWRWSRALSRNLKSLGRAHHA